MYDASMVFPHTRLLANRLRQAFDLFEAGLSMKRAQLRRDRPSASDDEIEAAVLAWLATRDGAEHGDAEGPARHMDARSA